jgi:hypothetical protein
MTIAYFRSRKLFLILSSLLLDSSLYHLHLHLHLDSVDPVSAPVSASATPLFWVAHQASGLCLGPYGFQDCGELSLWHWLRTDHGIQLQLYNSKSDIDKTCLGRSIRGKLKMRSCRNTNPFAGLYWTYDESTGKLSSKGGLSSILGPTCVINNGDGMLSNCRQGYSSLQLLPFHAHHDEADQDESIGNIIEDEEEEIGLQQEGSWTCSESGQILPRNLDAVLSGPRQVLMGAGLFTKVDLLHMTFYM